MAYREAGPAKAPTRIVRNPPLRARIGAAIFASIALGCVGWQLPSTLTERTFACDRAEARCTLDVDRSLLGTVREQFSLSEIVGARTVPHITTETSSWETVVDTARGPRSLGSFHQELECRTTVGRVASFLGGSGDSLFLRVSRSLGRLVILLGLEALFGFTLVAGLLKRISLSFDWAANRIEVRRRRRAFWQRPAYYDLKDVFGFELREVRDGEGGTTSSVVLVSRHAAEAVLWTEASRDRQFDFVQELNKVLAENRPPPLRVDAAAEVDAAPLETESVEATDERRSRAG